MIKLLLKTSLAFLLATTSLTSFANQVTTTPTQNKGIEKHYVMRITSLDPSHQVTVYGSYMELARNFTRVTNVTGQVTPIEVDVQTIGLSTQLMAGNDFKVEVFEKNHNKELPLLSGSGHAVVSFNDSASIQYVYAR